MYEDETDVIQPSFIFADFFPTVINSLPSEAFEIARIRHDATKWLPEITQRIVNCELIADNVTLQRIYRTTFDDNLLKLLCKQNPIDGFSLAIHALYEDELTQLEGGNLQKIRELLLIATPEAARKAQYTLGQLYTKHGHQWLIAHLWTGELSDLREATKLINARKHTHDVTEEVAKATSLARLLIPKIDFKGLCVLRSFMSDLDYEIISPEKLISEAEGLAVFEYKELESLSLGLEEAKLSLSELNRSKALTIKASLSDEALMKLASLYDSCQFLAAALTDKWNRILIDESRGAPITSSRRIKPDWLLFHRVLEYNDVKYLYHFTDRANLQSIKARGGLLSWWHCKQKSIGIARPGGGTTSQNLDQHYGLEDFVRLSFAAEHPMMHVALKDGRIQSPIVLKIDPSICFLEDTKFSNLNATKTGHSNGATLAHLEAVKFYVVSDNYFDLSTEDKHYYQAEVLVKTWVPLRYITNLDRFI